MDRFPAGDPVQANDVHESKWRSGQEDNRFFPPGMEDVIVVHDDLDLPSVGFVLSKEGGMEDIRGSVPSLRGWAEIAF